MSAITFDTLKFVERLEQAGVPRAQAAAIAEAQRDVFSEALESELATKGDIRAVREDLTGFGARIDRRIDAIDAEIRLLKWMMGVLIAIAIANFAKQFF